MAIREIVVVGSADEEILRKSCRPVTDFDGKLRTLLDDMAETMYFEGRGVGLAAPQIGIRRQIFVADVGDDTGLHEFINPEIVEMEGEVVSSEGCLSIPGVNGDVLRPEKVTIRAQDRFGKEFTLIAEDFLAICICHEYDHLTGTLFTDKVV